MWIKADTDYRLYLIADYGIAQDSLPERVSQALAGGVTAVQLRAKELSTRKFYTLGEKLLVITRDHRVPLIINDRLDVALALGAAGVHLGQDDMPPDKARAVMGARFIIGVSARTYAEALSAEQQGADYIGVGAVFPTATKDDASFTPLTTVADIARQLSIPVLAIGGINAGNANAVLDHGVCGLCVAGAILNAPSPNLAAAELRALVHHRRR